MTPRSPDPEARWTRVQTRDLLRFVLRRLREERLPEVAGSLTYTTVLALVPVLTIAFAIFTTFPLFTTFRDSLEAYFVQSVMPRGVANTTLDYLTQFSAKASRLSAAGAVFLIVTAIFMFGTVDRTLNRLWRVRETRPFLQRMVVYWSVMTMGPLLLGASLTAASEFLPLLGAGSRKGSLLLGALTLLLSLGLSTLAFALLYQTVPNRQVDWREAVIGGLVAAIAFEITRRLFAFAINLGGGYRAIYGALAAVPIFLIWVYLFWLITLLGAVVAAALPVVRYERWWHSAAPGGEFLDAMAVLKVLIDARAGQAAVDVLKLRELTRLGFEESDALLQRMLEAGWVARLRSDGKAGLRWRRRSWLRQERWTLLASPERLTLAEIYRRFAFAPAPQSPLAARVDRMVERDLSLTLADYFAASEAKRNSVSST
jgi:membrane protein